MKDNKFWKWTKDEDTGERILRLDGNAEDTTVEILLKSAQNLAMDIARIDDESDFDAAGDIAKTAVLYVLGYLYENRGDTDGDYHKLTLALRSLLFGIRKQGF